MSSPLSLFDLHGRTALVTGGSRGLGLEMARTLGLAGARLVITARKVLELQDAQKQLLESGIDAVAYQHDLADHRSTAPLVERIEREVGAIDILVNNAGTTWGGAAATLELDAWMKVVSVNLTGTWVLTQAVAACFMIPRKAGSIVIVASVQGLGGVVPGGAPTVAYNTTKAGQINLARALAAEWGPHHVRVNSLLPGWLPTKMTHTTLNSGGESLKARIPLGRLGEPSQDIGGPVLFLASDASRYVTGHALVVDGGLTCAV
ncbi:MAG TPA: SDR family oxidoreductase [Gemmatimonadaceae bacterium]